MSHMKDTFVFPKQKGKRGREERATVCHSNFSKERWVYSKSGRNSSGLATVKEAPVAPLTLGNLLDAN